MTNIFATPDKVSTKTKLFNCGVAALEQDGWKVERIPKVGKSSVRRIVRQNESKVVTIRTTQDTYIAFPRNDDDTEWVTLSMVDMVVAVSVDDAENPRFAKVHFIDGDEMRDRFNRSYDARITAGHTIGTGRGMWLGLYDPEQQDLPSHVGAGAGLAHPAIATFPLDEASEIRTTPAAIETSVSPVNGPLSISEARRLLAETFGVDPSNVEITIRV
ncbi:hypothetical protein [Sphingopyxis sp. JAI108]|uniref:hypothetical protein n=1 Tax=Sphingopyxis sp. JAI108 TaxID=2723060 RepID=UPI0015CCD8A6|nr:hypothetical protein [Sphingopyxis sp. JAI108]NYF33808.1 hypothetical protein [Sphingopyxis sp. JAI108]